MSLNTNLTNIINQKTIVYKNEEENTDQNNVEQNPESTAVNTVELNYISSNRVLDYMASKSYVKITNDNINQNVTDGTKIDTSVVLVDESKTNSTDNDGVTGTVSPKKVTSANKITINATNIQDIKAAVYNFKHPTVTGVTTSYGTKFEEIAKTLGFSPSKSTITRQELITYIRANEDKEDENNDLFGAINFAFSDRAYDEEITYQDIQLFFMRGAGYGGEMTLNEYKIVVNDYAQKLQNEYLALPSPKKKLEFILDKTEDYLKAAGLDLQLAALNRLKKEDGTENTNPNGNQICSIGQIAFADLGGWEFDKESGYSTITNGCYGSFAIPHENANPYDSSNRIYGSSWYFDDNDSIDEGGNRYDMGITLNSNYINGYNLAEDDSHIPYNWYELVEVMVHELTHATAYYYYDVTNTMISASSNGLDYMVNLGIITSSQRSFIENNPFTMATSESQDVADAAYYINTMYGEYAAYIQSANYYDSIAGDVFNSSHDLCVKNNNQENNNQEKDAIKNHVASLYDSDREFGDYEAIPYDELWDVYGNIGTGWTF